MILRDATFADLETLLPLAREAHLRSVFAEMTMNEAIVQRNFVTAMQFDDGFAKVVEKDNEVVGGMVGIISENHFGIRCAQDLFTYSNGGTDILIKAFQLWAKIRECKFAQITDLSGDRRYQRLITDLGLVQAGTNFIEVA